MRPKREPLEAEIDLTRSATPIKREQSPIDVDTFASGNQDEPIEIDSDSDDADDAPGPAAQRRKKRHRGGKRIPMAERRRRNRRTVQVTLAPLREMEFVEGPSWCPEDEMWFEGFGMW